LSKKLQTNPHLVVRLDGLEKGCISLAIESGTNRQSFNCNDPAVVEWLLEFRTPKTRLDGLALTEQLFSINSDSAEKLLNGFIETQLIVEERSHSEAVYYVKELWEKYGWRDAFDFHTATQDLIFNADYEDYREAMNDYSQAVQEGLDQKSPDAYKEYYDKARVPLARTRKRIDAISFNDTIRLRQPFQPYSSDVISFEQFSELMEHTYCMRSETQGLLGLHMKRTSPSGGARHPIEAYVAVNNIQQISCGLYHYSPKHHCLELLKEGDYRNEVGSLCFEKTAIKTAAATIFLTARWTRHMWKYRYARSYRMVLFDTGHLIQTNVLVGCAIGLRSFLCPSVHDSNCLSFLGLEQDCEEGVLYAIGIGAM
jgi:SagB-type dehydrogenase family enzyme